jgi:hypothetical protein
MGATEDAASRRPARPGGTRLIVKRVLSPSPASLSARGFAPAALTIGRLSGWFSPSSTLVERCGGAAPRRERFILGFPPRWSGEKSAMFLDRRVLLLIYIGVGIAIAWTHHYFNHLNTWRQILSALLAILLWPLVLLGISLHIHK